MSALISAFMLLTRLPVRGTPIQPAAKGVWAWPLVGLVVGGLAAFVLWAGTMLGLPAGLPAVLALTTSIVITGALHEDGLADVADGFWGGHTPERRLEIMRDSRLGSYGALALGLSLIARFALLFAAAETQAWGAVIVAAIFSRAAMAWVLADRPARKDGLGRSAGIPDRTNLWVASLAALIALLVHQGTAPLAGFVAVLLVIGLVLLARRKIGGQTGDVCGTAQQISEIAILAVLLAG